MFSPRLILAVPIVAVVFASCSSGGAGVQATTPLPVSKHANGSFALTIKIPNRQPAASNNRHSAFVSPSTQSMSMAFSQGSTLVLSEAIGLTPSSNPNCSVGVSSTTCSITVGLAAGSYTATVATYDGPISGNVPTGNALSQGQSLAVAVIASQTNSVALTLDGVPASISVTPTSSSTITGTQAGGFSVKYGPQPLQVVARDSDGNIILGPGAPTFTVAATASKYTVTQPQTSTPNVVTLAAVGAGSGTLTVSAAPPNGGFSCSSSGVVCTATVAISTVHQLFVAGYSGLSVYTSSDDTTWTLTSVDAGGYGANATAMAVAANGTAFIAVPPSGFGSTSIYAYSPPYTAPPAVITGGLNSPVGMAVTSTQRLLVADGSTLHVYASPWTGSSTNASFGFNSNSLALDPADNAIVGSSTAARSFPAPGYATSTSIGTADVYTLATNPAGTLVIGPTLATYVNAYTPPYTAAPVTLTLPNLGGVREPARVAVDVHGNAWMTAVHFSTSPQTSCTNPCPYYIFEFQPPFTAGEAPAASIALASTASYTVMTPDSSGHIIVLTGSTTLSIINASGTLGTITNGISYPRAILYVK
jgi:hypothetical protein